MTDWRDLVLDCIYKFNRRPRTRSCQIQPGTKCKQCFFFTFSSVMAVRDGGFLSHCVFSFKPEWYLDNERSKLCRGPLRAVPLPKGFALTINLPWKKVLRSHSCRSVPLLYLFWQTDLFLCASLINFRSNALVMHNLCSEPMATGVEQIYKFHTKLLTTSKESVHLWLALKVWVVSCVFQSRQSKVNKHSQASLVDGSLHFTWTFWRGEKRQGCM